ncbi:NlpC/P60 family protein [Desulfitobacterium sp. THU1]|uniref:C40 family peptidase n=1 Tax=Desulfitobacterium sp. THU1 TaxID=3138072 RepID=UPI00311DAC4C
MNILYSKKWLSVAVISGVLLASSLYNAVPTQAYTVPSSTSLELGIPFQLIESLGQDMIAAGVSVADDSFKKEILQEKKWLRQLSKEQPQLSAKKSQEPAESKSTEVKIENIKREVSTSPAPTIPKPTPTQRQKPIAQKSSPPAVSRGAGEVEQLLNRANRLIGVPYLWGGTTPKGFDCSGFVGYVFKASGISLPRTSFDMYKIGTPVKRNELKPGDLIFFSTYTEGASDVRIYIGGNSTIGASSGGVDIRSLSESYWDNHYYGARRVL